MEFEATSIESRRPTLLLLLGKGGSPSTVFVVALLRSAAADDKSELVDWTGDCWTLVPGDEATNLAVVIGADEVTMEIEWGIIVELEVDAVLVPRLTGLMTCVEEGRRSVADRTKLAPVFSCAV